MPIESGPTGERKVRSLLLFLMVFSFALWFAYDGWIGYPAENIKENVEQLPLEYRETAKNPRIYDTVHEGNTPAVRKLIKQHFKDFPTARAKLEEFYGGPPSFEIKDAIYYFGPSYHIIFRFDAVDKDEWIVARKTEKTATSILWQKGLAIGLLAYSAYLFLFVMRVRKTRLVLDQDGLSFRGVGPITWESMRSLDISRFSRKGFVDLMYDDNGAERRLRLDEYHLEKFDDIIDELCAKKGFENPLPLIEEPASPTQA